MKPTLQVSSQLQIAKSTWGTDFIHIRKLQLIVSKMRNIRLDDISNDTGAGSWLIASNYPRVVAATGVRRMMRQVINPGGAIRLASPLA
jgi:hypothetical protein